ncbi:SDR family oxidoreductase [Burkholderia lata]|uniref:SDR family oxidoreductase n=1 Tax=Burkholderia lata (strain ATCC 17760 / DSM 23089 / LMG 22485 / NCIMB 9086 / R18194 / 383) TaxID=482957 RepID=UPI001583A891
MVDGAAGRVDSPRPGKTLHCAGSERIGSVRTPCTRVKNRRRLLSNRVAAAVCFLASQAVSFIAGADFPVDGGYVAKRTGR